MRSHYCSRGSEKNNLNKSINNWKIFKKSSAKITLARDLFIYK